MSRKNQVATLDALAFREWLEARRDQLVGCSAEDEYCPLARFLTEKSGSECYSIGYRSYRVKQSRVGISLPAWAAAFVKCLDFTHPLEEVAGWQALRILDEVSHA